jgi:succinate dehydrogenase / fumarate reductase, iron-sulfur subunit
MKEKICLKVYRGVPGKQYWELFDIDTSMGNNIISALMYLRKHPINIKGERVAPIVWEDGCLEEVCGSCSMLINGRPRQACTALLEDLVKKSGKREIILAPFSKFPLIRDLMVDRSRMFESLKKIKGWIEVDGYYDKEAAPRIDPKKQEIRYVLSTCMTTGNCIEACPQSSLKSHFIGASAISQTRLFNTHPTGVFQKEKRLKPLMEKGGIHDCGNAQNCEKVCPKDIPLIDSIAAVGRDVTLHALKTLFSFKDRE